jgi:hypothetical protein
MLEVVGVQGETPPTQYIQPLHDDCLLIFSENSGAPNLLSPELQPVKQGSLRDPILLGCRVQGQCFISHQLEGLADHLRTLFVVVVPLPAESLGAPFLLEGPTTSGRHPEATLGLGLACQEAVSQVYKPCKVPYCTSNYLKILNYLGYYI